MNFYNINYYNFILFKLMLRLKLKLNTVIKVLDLEPLSQ